MKIKCLAALLIIICLLSAGKAASAMPAEFLYYQDLKNSFAEEPVKKLSALGIVEGLGPNEFRPNDPITRSQFALWLAKTMGISPVYPQENSFRDIPLNTLESGYIESLASLGVLNGTAELNFMPEKPITRQDAAVLIHKIAGKKSEYFSAGTNYKDRELISSYASNSVAFVTYKGWMSGYNQYFHPLRQMTRAEAAALLSKLLNSRKSEALTAIPTISSRQKSITAGETGKIEFETAELSLPFKAVFGTDTPNICDIDCDGVLTGIQAGNSIITVNTGYNSFRVNMSVKASKPGLAVTGEKDYGHEINLNYTVTQQTPDVSFKQIETKNNPGPPDGLTSKSDTWTGFLRQKGRDILVDLQKTASINGVSLEFLQNPSWGVWFPEYLKAEISLDGKYWQHLGYVYPGVNPSGEETQYAELTLAFSPVNTRYIKLSFPVDIWVFARHLSVKSSADAVTPAVLATAGLSENPTADVISQTANREDILLVYTGDNSINQTFKTHDFTPLITYQERSGKIKGRMFDTILFLPYYGMPADKNIWSLYIEDLFAPDKQLQALDKAVDWVNTYSDIKTREKVILTIPYPDINQGLFKTTQDRFTAVKWYYDSIIEKWNSADFKNIDLVGIYWYGESIEKYPGEKELLLNTARMVRNDNLDFYWIPYYGVKGYENWRSYGFTKVFLQPNYFSINKPPLERMDVAAKITNKYNLGVEIELDEAIFTNEDFYNIFYSQLKRGKELGLDKLNNAYYAGHVKKTLLMAARSIDPKIRSVYDDLYLWLSGNYE